MRNRLHEASHRSSAIWHTFYSVNREPERDFERRPLYASLPLTYPGSLSTDCGVRFGTTFVSPSIFATTPQRRIPHISAWNVTRRGPAGNGCDPNQTNRVAGHHCICWHCDGSWRQVVPTRRPREGPDNGANQGRKTAIEPGDRYAPSSGCRISGKSQAYET